MLRKIVVGVMILLLLILVSVPAYAGSDQPGRKSDSYGENLYETISRRVEDKS